MWQTSAVSSPVNRERACAQTTRADALSSYCLLQGSKSEDPARSWSICRHIRASRREEVFINVQQDLNHIDKVINQESQWILALNISCYPNLGFCFCYWGFVSWQHRSFYQDRYQKSDSGHWQTRLPKPNIPLSHIILILRKLVFALSY